MIITFRVYNIVKLGLLSNLITIIKYFWTGAILLAVRHYSISELAPYWKKKKKKKKTNG